MLKLLRFFADKSPLAADSPAARDSVLAAMPSTFGPTPPRAASSSPWSRLRGPAAHALAESSFAWALDLPRDVRPTQLLVRYPRVANRLALSWTDARLTDRVFDSLARNTRDGRRGFPPHVAEELRLLQAHHEATRKDAARNQPRPAARPVVTPFPTPEPVTQPVPLSPAYDDAWAAQATSDR